MPLDRDFLDLFTSALMREPGMINIRSHKHEFQVVDGIDMITHDPAGSFGIQDQIQFHFFVIMQRKTELPLDTGENRETIVLRKWSDLTHNSSTHVQSS